MTLAEKLAASIAAAKAIRTKAKAENREMTEAEAADVQKHLDAADATKGEIAAEEKRVAANAALSTRLDAEDAALRTSAGRRSDPGSGAPLPGATTQPAVARERVLDDPRRGFANLADFAREILDCGQNRGAIENNPRLRAAAGDGMSAGVTADGGVLVPPAFRAGIWDGARQASNSLLQFCDVSPVDMGVESVTLNATAETSRADGSRWGGVRGYWKDELSALTGSKPTFREMTIRPHELYVFGYISDKLLRQAPGMASAILAKAAADEINFKVGDAIFGGNGTGKPSGAVLRGAVSQPGAVEVQKETGQVARTVVKANIDKMWARCHANWRANAVWLINQDVEPELENLSMVVGTGGVPVYLPAGGISETPHARLKGRPVIVVEYAPTRGTVGDISLANLSSYCVGLRGMVDQASSMHLKFDYAQSAFRFIFEIDGQPYLASPITPYKGSDTLSPIVTLATRS